MLVSCCKQQKWTLGKLSKKNIVKGCRAAHKIEGKTKEPSSEQTQV